jgi:hypothetical protein
MLPINTKVDLSIDKRNLDETNLSKVLKKVTTASACKLTSGKKLTANQ